MVQVKKDGKFFPYNKYESCRLHDLMRDLCLSKVEKEGFFKVSDCWKKTNYVPPDSTTSRLAILSEGRDLDNYINEIGEAKGLRSLLVLRNPKEDFGTTLNPRDCVIIFNKLKFLRILVLVKCEFKGRKLPSEVGKLIHLRYLSLSDSEVEKLPLSTCNLLYLQTLDLRGWFHIKIPNVIHKMKRLRHLFVKKTEGNIVISVNREILILDGLKELETLEGFNSRCFRAEDIPKLTSLRNLDAQVYDINSLSIIVHHMHNNNSQLRKTHLGIESCDFSSEEGSDIFRKLLMSRLLIHLWLDSCTGCSLPCYLPGMCTNLVDLFLRNSRVAGDDVMEILGKFPMLKSLYLYGDVLSNTKMVCSATSFPQLRSLKLNRISNLEKWEVEKTAMPNLSEIAIHVCAKLEMIPDGLRFITTLQHLSCDPMPKEFNDRLRVVNDREGEDYHKISHIPEIFLENEGDGFDFSYLLP